MHPDPCRRGGPKTDDAKARSSRYSLKHGLLLSRRVLLADEDPAEFESHVEAYREEFEPAGPVQTASSTSSSRSHGDPCASGRSRARPWSRPYADTLPILAELPEEAQHERALISTVCNANVPTIRRYAVAADRDYSRTLHELSASSIPTAPAFPAPCASPSPSPPRQARSLTNNAGYRVFSKRLSDRFRDDCGTRSRST